MPADKIRSTERKESADGSGSIDLSLSTDVIGYNGRPSRKMQFGRVENVFEADKAIAALIEKAD